MHKFQKLLPKPHPDSVNSGLSPLHQNLMLNTFGVPGNIKKAQDCTIITSQRLSPFIVTQSVGPFRVTGHLTALESLKRIFTQVKQKDPELYSLLKTAGMTCCRLVRGSKTQWSNHSFGFAIDIMIGEELDTRGDDLVQVGLMRLYPYFHAEGWYWLVEGKIEDGMHFEASSELFLDWKRKGLI